MMGSRKRVIIGIMLMGILVLGIDSALGVTTISNTIISGVTAFVSSNGSAVTTGAVRLGNAEDICWRSSPSANDICVQVDANEDVLFNTNTNNINLNSNPLTNAMLGGTLNANNNILDNVQFMESNAGTPAATGIIRLSNAENGICWEPNPSGTAEVCLSVDASEDFVFDTDTNNINLNSNPLTNAILGGTVTGQGHLLDNVDLEIETGIKADSATEIGIQVTNSALTVGSLGSIAVPVKTTAGAPSDAEGGNLDGSIVFNTADNTLYCRDGAAWLTCGPRYVVKTADETVNNSTTFQNDDHLFFNCEANKVYGFYIALFHTTTATADIKFTWTLPSGATGDWGQIDDTTQVAYSSITATMTETTTGNVLIAYTGRILMGSTAGTCQLQWAQNTLEAANALVLRGSYLMVFES